MPIEMRNIQHQDPYQFALLIDGAIKQGWKVHSIHINYRPGEGLPYYHAWIIH